MKIGGGCQVGFTFTDKNDELAFESIPSVEDLRVCLDRYLSGGQAS
jgi:hypothetical protein